MLTSALMRRLCLAAATASMVTVALVAVTGVATADDCNDAESGQIDYCNPEEDEEEDGGNGDGGSGGNDDGGNAEPTCDFSLIEGHEPYTQQWCEGETACFKRVPALSDPFPDEEAQKPREDAIWTYWQCVSPDGSSDYAFEWLEPDGPTLEERAWTAYGELDFPAFSLEFNPPQRTYVTLPTWWWVDGPTQDTLTGTDAAGLIAYATPLHIEVTPGDGSPGFECPWTTAKSDACPYIYNRASVSGTATGPTGSPAYLAQATLVYDIRFELDGQEIATPAGIPDPWVSNPQTVAVEVAEIQGIVAD